MAPRNFVAKTDFVASHFVIDADLQQAVMEESDMLPKGKTSTVPTYSTLQLTRQEVA